MLTRSVDFRAEVRFENVVVTKSRGFRKDPKSILHGISGHFSAGKMVAILGPSGAGKSTLLNALSGFDTSGATGEFLVNGEDRILKNFKKTSCYITQENDLNVRLTVEENMRFAADLKLGTRKSRREKQEMIENVLSMLGLEVTLKTRTSDLSGGQMKRLSIAMELLSNPTVIFLDEPTTGLDSFASCQCMRYLKTLASEGRTIICTIHQPSASLFKLFDVIYLLASGKCLYQGGIRELMSTLRSIGAPCNKYHNPADHIIDLASGDYGIDKIHQLLKTSNNGKNLTLEVTNNNSFDLARSNNEFPPKTSGLYEFLTLLRREALKSSRNKTLTHLRIYASIAISIFLSMIFWKMGKDASKIWFNYNMVLAYIIANVIGGVLLTVLVFPLEFKVLKKEYFNGYYSMENYFAAITVVDLPISVLCCSLLNFIVYCASGQPLEFNRMMMFYFTSLVLTLIAQSLGLLLGTVLDIKNGAFMGSYIHFPLMLVSGFALNLSDLSPYFYWASYASYLRYSLICMLGALYRHGREKLHCPDDKFCLYSYGGHFLDDVGVDGRHFAVDFSILCAIYVALRFASYVSMRCALR